MIRHRANKSLSLPNADVTWASTAGAFVDDGSVVFMWKMSSNEGPG